MVRTPQIIYKDPHEPTSVVLASLEPGDDNLCWHPGMYVGHWEHPNQGYFDLENRHLDEYMASFEAHIPGPAGIPVDENPNHTIRQEGAWGWAKALQRKTLEVRGRATDAILLGYEWTKAGIAAIEDGTYKYISLHFTVDKQDSVYGRPNAIIAANLCTRPFFPQPELMIGAAMEVDMDAARMERKARSKKWGIEERDDGHLTAPSAYRGAAPNPDDYGDPVNFKYPLKPDANLRNASARFSQNASRYSEKARRIVYTRIVRAMKSAGMKHSPNEKMDRMLPPDLRAWMMKS